MRPQLRDLVLMTIAPTMAIIALTVSVGALDPSLNHIALLSVASAVGVVFAFTLLAINRSPITFTISLLGFPKSGKSVYLTVLFDELQRGHAPGIKFRPYGQESAEKVSENLTSLMKGTWLPPTEPGSVFYYRAIAEMVALPWKRIYKLEVGDFAGENIKELDPSCDKWLHKSSYFRYVVQSDGVMLAVDTAALLDGDIVKHEEMQNAFVTALNVLIESKASIRQTRLTTPVALVFMKSDLLKNQNDRNRLQIQMDRLIEVCKNRCRDFECFFVSSTGPLDNDGRPGPFLQPMNVAQPVIWLVKRGRSLFGGPAYHYEKSETATLTS